MTHKFPYTITLANITVFVSGQIVKIPSTHNGFVAMAAHLQSAEHDAETILKLADKRQGLARLTAGKVTVVGDTVYYAGVPIRSALATRLVTLTDMGHDATPWALFMDNVGQNPSENSKERLFEFIDRWETPLTPDGCFIAFKGVNDDYSSTRLTPEGESVYNRPGMVIEMDRADVVEDPSITCASGLHACASHYLDSFWGTQHKVLAMKINPRDVVSIPDDYNLSKMRVCKYEVLGDIVDERHRDRIEGSQVVVAGEGGIAVPQEVAPIEILGIGARGTPPSESLSLGAAAHLVAGDHPITYKGTTYEHVPDTDVDEGGMAQVRATGDVGKVISYGVLSYNESEHPEHLDWQEGGMAGDEIKDVLAVWLELEDGSTSDPITWYETDKIWPLSTLREIDPMSNLDRMDANEGYENDDYGDGAEDCDPYDEDWDPYDDDYDADSYESPLILDESQRVPETIDDETQLEIDKNDDVLTFKHTATGREFSAPQLVTAIEEVGQRGFSRTYNIPRTTLQDWMRRAQDAGY